MLRSLETAVSGLQNFQGEMDVISDNIANVNTYGFKASRSDFSDTLGQTLRGGTSSTDIIQVGSGVSTAAISSNFNQGEIATTGRDTDLAIKGDGFFVVKQAGGDELFATRVGNFSRTTDGTLVTQTGEEVQAVAAGGSTVGSIQIDPTKQYTVGSDGTINVITDTGTTVVGQLVLQKFTNPQRLVKDGNNLYSNLDDAGPLGGTTPTPAAPGTNGLGSIVAGGLEQSNVDLTNEFANLITAQRAFQANSKVMMTADEVLQELVALKR